MIIDVKVRLPKKPIGFNINTDNRPMFYGNKTQKKNNWIADTFYNEIEASFTENGTLNGYVNIKFNNLEVVKSIPYVMIELQGFNKFYFVESVTIKNNTTARLDLVLDSITTYLDIINFDGATKIQRKHFDRYKKVNNKLVPNMSEESGIWNDDTEIHNTVFIPLRVEPILTDIYKGLLEKYKNKKGDLYVIKTFFSNLKPVIIMNASGKYTDTSMFLADNYNYEIVGSIYTIYKWSSFEESRTGIKYTMDISTDKLEIASINKGFLTPFPIYPFKEYIPEDPNSAAGIDIVFTEKHAPNLANNPSWSHVPDSNPQDYVWNSFYGGSLVNDQWSSTMKTKDIFDFEDLISDDYNYKRELKLQTSKHKQITLSSLNGQNTKLINEYLIDTSTFKLDYTQLLSYEGPVVMTKIVAPMYDKFKDNSKIFTVSYKDQLPTPTSNYATYMLNHGNSYKTGLANNRVNTASNVAGGLASGLAANAMMGPVAAVGGVVGAVSGLIHGITAERQMKAKIADLKNQGQSTEIDDIMVMKDITLMDKGEFGDTAMAIKIETHPKIQQQEIAMFYNKYGYESDRVVPIKDYTHLITRKRFSYWQIHNFENLVEKGNVPVEVLRDLNQLFSVGIRLWNSDEKINDYSKENWELGI